MASRRISPKVAALSAAAIIAVIAAVVALLIFVPILKVSKFEVHGNSQISAEEIEQATGLEPGQNLVTIDANAAASKVAQIPWVSKVTVNRKLPDTVVVEVGERQAVMFTHRNDGEHLIDSQGQPFIIDTPPPGSVELTNTKEDDPAIIKPAVDILHSLDDATRAQVRSIDAPSKFEYKIFTNDGKEIYWGSSENNEDKARAMTTVLKREGTKWNISAPHQVTVVQ